MQQKFILGLEEVSIEDVGEVGGKNASLGEMIQNLAPKGISIPGGYIITATAYRYFLEQTGLKQFIRDNLKGLDTHNLPDLGKKASTIRNKIENTEFPEDLIKAIREAHETAEKKYGKDSDFAVRSSATAEDLPGASFAGEHETYLNIRGEKGILKAIKAAMASLFTARAISYRVDKHFDHFQVALSVGIQKMVRSDKACSGVMFTLDTESGFPDVVLINGSWGLGEMIVQGQVTPDEFLIFKKTLGVSHFTPIISKKLGQKARKMIYDTGENATKVIETPKNEREQYVLDDKEILQLAKWAVDIENHYSNKHNKWTPMDLEWAKDGTTGKLYIVQARPETVQAEKDHSKINEYVKLEDKKPIIKGASVGNKISTGIAHIISSPKDINDFKKGEILITEVTDPDWEPIMKIASGIVTDKGGRTSHAAIVARELGIPAVVGTKNATSLIKTGQEITVDTTGIEGMVYPGKLKYEIRTHDINKIPQVKTKIMLNIATPDTAFDKSFLPNSGVGLAREEFIIASDIGVHPACFINYPDLPEGLKQKIEKKTNLYKDKKQFYIDHLAYGVAKIATAFYPKPIILRFSDFKSNEYKSLLGGDLYEPNEENPMIGWRGASRYYSEDFKQSFLLEIKAIRKVREEMGLDNVMVMVPFCRTPEEGQKVVDILEENGLSRKKSNLKVYVMCEIPSNVMLAEEFLEVFDGMSIGSNDLTQLVLGIDRDGNEKIRSIANENNPAVKKMVSQVIKICKAKNKYIGICGQAPSDYPEFTRFLVEEGIESISLNPDSVIKMAFEVNKIEQRS